MEWNNGQRSVAPVMAPRYARDDDYEDAENAVKLTSCLSFPGCGL